MILSHPCKRLKGYRQCNKCVVELVFFSTSLLYCIINNQFPNWITYISNSKNCEASPEISSREIIFLSFFFQQLCNIYVWLIFEKFISMHFYLLCMKHKCSRSKKFILHLIHLNKNEFHLINIIFTFFITV